MLEYPEWVVFLIVMGTGMLIGSALTVLFWPVFCTEEELRDRTSRKARRAV